MSEKHTQNAILHAFATRPDIRLWRQNVGQAVPLSTVKQALKAMQQHRWADANLILRTAYVIKFGVKGQADLSGILMGSGKRLEIECKSATGTPREDQVVYGETIERFGGIYVLARSVEDVSVILDKEL